MLLYRASVRRTGRDSNSTHAVYQEEEERLTQSWSFQLSLTIRDGKEICE